MTNAEDATLQTIREGVQVQFGGLPPAAGIEQVKAQVLAKEAALGGAYDVRVAAMRRFLIEDCGVEF